MISAAHKIRTARENAGLSQVALAAAAGVRQSQISLYERGIVKPQDDVAERILRAARERSRLSADLRRFTDRLLALAERHHISRLRVYDGGGSDGSNPASLLVTLDSSASPYDLSAFAVQAEDLLDYSVEVVSDAEPSSPRLERILAEAVPLITPTRLADAE